ncbi:MAG: hypothetical protein DMENIID0003_07540 [Wolbachia endosymbiont of Sergentomyia squamirostris]|uniref:Transposase n=1 Tax=Wolbachia endosymbiont of Sergentomyia squamirostris TaxID=3113640 RepID=A0AAT9GCY7_9RICK
MSHILESGNFWDASMRQKQVIPNLMVNPCEQSWIRLRKELVFELSSAGICEIRLIRIDQNGRSAKRNQDPTT